MRKHTANGAGDEHEDTVEKAIAGVAEMIIRDDEAKRAEELVRFGVVCAVVVGSDFPPCSP